MKFRSLAIISVLVLTACANAPSRVYVKNEVTWVSYRADLETCRAQAEEDLKHTATATHIPTGAGVGGAIAVGIIGGIVQGIARAKAVSEQTGECMVERGYSEVALAESQRTELGRLESDEQKTQFLRGEPIEELSVIAARNSAPVEPDAPAKKPQPVTSAVVAPSTATSETSAQVAAQPKEQAASSTEAQRNLLSYWRLREDILRKGVSKSHIETSAREWIISEFRVQNATIPFNEKDTAILEIEYAILRPISRDGFGNSSEPYKFTRKITVDNQQDEILEMGTAHRIS